MSCDDGDDVVVIDVDRDDEDASTTTLMFCDARMLGRGTGSAGLAAQETSRPPEKPGALSVSSSS